MNLHARQFDCFYCCAYLRNRLTSLFQRITWCEGSQAFCRQLHKFVNNCWHLGCEVRPLHWRKKTPIAIPSPHFNTIQNKRMASIIIIHYTWTSMNTENYRHVYHLPSQKFVIVFPYMVFVVATSFPGCRELLTWYCYVAVQRLKPVIRPVH